MAKIYQIALGAGIVGVFASGVLNVMALHGAVKTISVEETNQTIPAYTTITQNEVHVVQMPIEALQADTITQNVVGKVTTMSIPAGSPFQTFELSAQGNLFSTIQHLSQTYPNLTFVQIDVENNLLSAGVQPGQHVTLLANGTAFPNIWVLSVSTDVNATNGAINAAISSAFGQNTPNVTAMLIGAPWGTIQALMNAKNVQVIAGTVGGSEFQNTAPYPTASASEGAPPPSGLAQPPASFQNGPSSLPMPSGTMSSSLSKGGGANVGTK
ncbi:SAF domain-containing protein [Sulfoacidibacillus thermotolerans]|uniref:SAF domain-containing protein n=1 Tax=Sulfoacidibacillus thermotolerans TaxID=1765684 RepID=A0A2U3D5L7_SULT2|nr:SAF domain-containing protein [Sulfoacidibacillus thermotolerans]PWI56572.1 hypothetical protein BM613_13065 [Sulfoacidibacillus thermotolerans]PWI56592.1 hypothetical protein BM613_12885 [Sulfoacidibacillus thermotolerans]